MISPLRIASASCALPSSTTYISQQKSDNHTLVTRG